MIFVVSLGGVGWLVYGVAANHGASEFSLGGVGGNTSVPGVWLCRVWGVSSGIVGGSAGGGGAWRCVCFARAWPC